MVIIKQCKTSQYHIQKMRRWPPQQHWRLSKNEEMVPTIKSEVIKKRQYGLHSNIGDHQNTRIWPPQQNQRSSKNVEIRSVISFIEETVNTLKVFGELLKIQLKDI